MGALAQFDEGLRSDEPTTQGLAAFSVLHDLDMIAVLRHCAVGPKSTSWRRNSARSRSNGSFAECKHLVRAGAGQCTLETKARKPRANDTGS